MARIYSDENFPVPVVEALRALGHDILTTHEAGKSGLAVPDNEVLDYAIAEKRAVLTINRKHFVRLHKEQPDHCGIIVCTVDADFAGQAVRIDDALRKIPSLNGELLRINRPDVHNPARI